MTRANVRARFGLSADVPVVGFVGRLTSDKGLESLVSACRLASESVRFQLWLMGAGEETDFAQRLIELAGECRASLIMSGHVSVDAATYAAMDVLCLPSRREGFPNVVLEAGSCGIPVIATDVTGCRDAVVDGLTGWLVPPYDEAALANAIVEAMTDPEERLRRGMEGDDEWWRSSIVIWSTNGWRGTWR